MKTSKDEAHFIFQSTHQTFKFPISNIILFELDLLNNKINIHITNKLIYYITYTVDNINRHYDRTFSTENIRLYILQDYKLLSNSLTNNKTIKLKSTLLQKIEDGIK